MVYDDKTKRFYHTGDCYGKLTKEREMTRRENEQWDALYQYLIKLHDLVVLPTANIVRFQDLRAGYTYKNGEKERQWKTGPSFALMLEAYELAEENIRWCIANKLNGGNDIRSISYCMAIMVNHLNEANEQRKNERRQRQAQLRVEAQEKNKDQSHYKNKYNKNKNDEMDISRFL